MEGKRASKPVPSSTWAQKRLKAVRNCKRSSKLSKVTSAKGERRAISRLTSIHIDFLRPRALFRRSASPFEPRKLRPRAGGVPTKLCRSPAPFLLAKHRSQVQHLRLFFPETAWISHDKRFKRSVRSSLLKCCALDSGRKMTLAVARSVCLTRLC